VTVPVTERRGMDRPGFPVERLVRSDGFDGVKNRGCRDRGPRGRAGKGAFDLLQSGNAAKPATGVAGAVSHAIGDAAAASVGQRNAHDPAALGFEGFDRENIVGRVRETFGQHEAAREILQIGGAHHHDGIAEAVDLDCDGRLDRDIAD
jgi:hypothetical protein